MTIQSFSFEIRKPGYNQRQISRQQKNIDYRPDFAYFGHSGPEDTVFFWFRAGF
tara:strand:- start:835 stop:996 length:162 start_codon:yes stop_codon:yes gene_type:complete